MGGPNPFDVSASRLRGATTAATAANRFGTSLAPPTRGSLAGNAFGPARARGATLAPGAQGGNDVGAAGADVMNNPRMQKYSRSYTDQNGNLIEQRCFFLFAGTDMQTGSAFELEVTFHNFDDPKMQK